MSRRSGGKENATTKSDGRGKSPRNTDVRWFNPSPSSHDVQWLEDRGDDLLADCFTLLHGVQDHERLSIKYDVNTSRWLAILFDDAAVDEGHVQAMSVRGATAIDAIALLAYFVNVKFADGWVNETAASTGRFG